ncbi:MSC_0623 family F1-like ATPase-associated protein [Mycoplasmopsis columboralis]|uniref:Protein of uncharacterized function (DUF2714) n=1 Tax=Mycoplasmopsis columboralis TaxID=171282 RepID=A0A449B6B7_9BACT|nr:DUF2714 domain-containing protein [Mycoplasmopsis columboralis]VEU76146.1 Protein of uncharacterised function (DUF2714) [Mycoplasmopsis columboralis]
MPRKQKINSLEVEYQNMIYADYHALKKSSFFVDFEKLINTFEVQENLSKTSNKWKNILAKINSFKKERKNVIFTKFTIRWNRNEKFSLTQLVPTISLIDSNSLDINLKNSSDEQENYILVKFNEFIIDLIDKGYILEIFQDTILLLDKSSRNYKILFSEELLKNESPEN